MKLCLNILVMNIYKDKWLEVFFLLNKLMDVLDLGLLYFFK